MSFGYDEELPAGFQEADLEMREYEAQSVEAAALHRRGICTHSMMMGRSETVNRSLEDIQADRALGKFPDRPTDPTVKCQDDIPEGMVLCMDCGQLIEDLVFERRQ